MWNWIWPLALEQRAKNEVLLCILLNILFPNCKTIWNLNSVHIKVINISGTMKHLHTMKWILTNPDPQIIGTDQYSCTEVTHLLITHTRSKDLMPTLRSLLEVSIFSLDFAGFHHAQPPMLLSDPNCDLGILTYWKHDVLHFPVKNSNFIHNFATTRVTYLKNAINFFSFSPTCICVCV